MWWFDLRIDFVKKRRRRWRKKQMTMEVTIDLSRYLFGNSKHQRLLNHISCIRYIDNVLDSRELLTEILKLLRYSRFSAVLAADVMYRRWDGANDVIPVMKYYVSQLNQPPFITLFGLSRPFALLRGRGALLTPLYMISHILWDIIAILENSNDWWHCPGNACAHFSYYMI